MGPATSLTKIPLAPRKLSAQRASSFPPAVSRCLQYRSSSILTQSTANVCQACSKGTSSCSSSTVSLTWYIALPPLFFFVAFSVATEPCSRIASLSAQRVSSYRTQLVSTRARLELLLMGTVSRGWFVISWCLSLMLLKSP